MKTERFETWEEFLVEIEKLLDNYDRLYTENEMLTDYVTRIVLEYARAVAALRNIPNPDVQAALQEWVVAI